MPTTRYVIPSLGRLYDQLGGLAWVLLRVIYGCFFIPHGAQKLFGLFGSPGFGRIASGFDKLGFTPGWFWVGYIGSLELFGGILIVVGFLTRPVAALFFGFMFVGALSTTDNGYFWTKGGIEVPILMTVLALVIMIRGGGDFSVDKAIGREL